MMTIYEFIQMLVRVWGSIFVEHPEDDSETECLSEESEPESLSEEDDNDSEYIPEEDDVIVSDLSEVDFVELPDLSETDSDYLLEEDKDADEDDADEDSVKDEDELKKCKRELQELKTAFETEQKLQNDRFKMLQMFLNELLSGLYNSDTQQKKIDELSNMLYMCRYTGSRNRNTSIHRGRPTTRQGDECEKRIANIEYVLRMGTYHGENRIDKIENEIQKYREPIVVKTPPKREMTYDKSLRLGLNRQLYGV